VTKNLIDVLLLHHITNNLWNWNRL